MAFIYRDSSDRRPAADLPRFDSLQELHSYLALLEYRDEEARQERAAEQAAERYYEEGTASQREQYRWEVEQDERRAMGYAY